MPFDAADLAAFLDPSMPGYRPARLGEVTLGGLYRKPYAESFGMIGGNSPSFLALETDLAEVAPGDAIEIDGTPHAITSVQPNGAGLILLSLK